MILQALRVFNFIWVLGISSVYSSGICEEVYKPVSAKLWVFPEDKRKPFLEAMRQAKESIRIAAYKLSDPSLIQALKEAAQRGVRVKVLFEPVVYKHNRQTINGSQLQALEGNAFIELYPRSSEVFKQVHQKLLIVDREKAIIGTINLVAEFFDGGEGDAPTRDFALETEDREVVEELTQVFEADINDQSASYVHPNLIWGPHLQRAKVKHLIGGAQKTIYFYQQDIQDDDLINALITAIKRGVKVSSIMPPYPFDIKHQKDANIPHQNILIQAGGNVGIYPEDDLCVHAKAMLVDENLCIMSTNFYQPSLDENREVGLIVTKISSPEAVNDFKKVFSQDWEKCQKNVLRVAGKN